MTLASNLTSVFTRIGTEFKAIRTLISGSGTGNLSGLTTTDKASLVAAINEVLGVAEDAAGGGISEAEVDSKILTAINNLIASAPGALNTLDELAAALGDDANYAATITAALALKAPLASPSLTGTPLAPTATGGTNTTQIATTAFVTAAVSAGAPAASETVAGKAELATNAEVATGSDTSRIVTPAGLRSVTGDPETNLVTTFEAALA